jgi:hypothetical protein
MITVAAAANSGISVPAQPTVSWGSYSNPTSTFTITNLDSRSIYSLTPTTGSVSFNSSNGAISVNTSSEYEVTINVNSIKGNLAGTSKVIGRKNITTYSYTTGGGCLSAAPCGGPGCDCTLQEWCCQEYAPIYTVTAENSPPANYQKIGTVWVRV